jgi:hypothetical protein
VDQDHLIAERDVLRRAMTDIPDRQRAALGLRHVLDWSPEQVADHLGVQRNAADQLLLRARRSLRLSYERACAALWLLWPGHWKRGSGNGGRILDPRTFEVGIWSAPILERTLTVVVATMVAVGSTVAAGGLDLAQGAMRPPAVSMDEHARPAAPPPAAIVPPPVAVPVLDVPLDTPAVAGTANEPAPDGATRTVVEVDSAAVQPEQESPTDARTSAGTDDEGLVIEHELRSRLTMDGGGDEQPEDEHDTEADAGGGLVLSCDGTLTGEACEADQDLP